MNFTTIFFMDPFFEKQTDNPSLMEDFTEFFDSLKEQHIPFLFFTRNKSIKEYYSPLSMIHIKNQQEQEEFLRKYSPQSTLIISDDSRLLCGCKTLGYSCLGFSHTKEFLPATYCFEEISSLNFSYLEYVHRRCQHLPVTILQTESLLIREFTRKDIPALFGLYQQKTQLPYMYQPEENYPLFYDKFSSYIEQVYPFYDFGLWAVILKENGQLIGEFGLQCTQIDEIEEIELGYILHPHFQGKGYACQAIQAIFRYAREHLAFHRIVAVIPPQNEASVHVAQKCGMHFEKEIISHGQIFHLYAIFLQTVQYIG